MHTYLLLMCELAGLLLPTCHTPAWTLLHVVVQRNALLLLLLLLLWSWAGIHYRASILQHALLHAWPRHPLDTPRHLLSPLVHHHPPCSLTTANHGRTSGTTHHVSPRVLAVPCKLLLLGRRRHPALHARLHGRQLRDPSAAGAAHRHLRPPRLLLCSSLHHWPRLLLLLGRPRLQSRYRAKLLLQELLRSSLLLLPLRSHLQLLLLHLGARLQWSWAGNKSE